MINNVTQHIDEIKMEGEMLVLKSIPEKIMKIDGLLKLPEWNYVDLSMVHADLNLSVPDPIIIDGVKDGLSVTSKKRKLNTLEEEGTKVFTFPNGRIPINPIVKKALDTVKPLLREAMDDSNLLKMWLSLMIPKIEDGNNFGVSVQEDTLAEIQTVETEANASYEQIHRYFIARGKLVSKVAKYPHIDDYRESVNELDEKYYVSFRLMLKEIKNRYLILNDIVKKNMDKIKQPRNSNSVSLY